MSLFGSRIAYLFVCVCVVDYVLSFFYRQVYQDLADVPYGEREDGSVPLADSARPPSPIVVRSLDSPRVPTTSDHVSSTVDDDDDGVVPRSMDDEPAPATANADLDHGAMAIDDSAAVPADATASDAGNDAAGEGDGHVDDGAMQTDQVAPQQPDGGEVPSPVMRTSSATQSNSPRMRPLSIMLARTSAGFEGSPLAAAAPLTPHKAESIIPEESAVEASGEIRPIISLGVAAPTTVPAASVIAHDRVGSESVYIVFFSVVFS